MQIVSFSGGIGSFCVLKRVAGMFPQSQIMVVFMDTKFEDEDLYRFNGDVFAYLQLHLPGIRIERLCDGRTPVDIGMEDHVVLNNRFATCSKKLKSRLFKKWLKESGIGPDDAVIHIGIDAGETRRCRGITTNYKHEVRYLLIEEGVTDKQAMLQELQEWDIKIPRLYLLGFDHNNCGGRCFRGGIKHFKLLRRQLPARFYAFMETEKQMADNARLWHGTDNNYAILKRRKEPYTLAKLDADCVAEEKRSEGGEVVPHVVCKLYHCKSADVLRQCCFSCAQQSGCRNACRLSPLSCGHADPDTLTTYLEGFRPMLGNDSGKEGGV